MGAMILKLAYGYEIEEKEDALVGLVDRALDAFTRATTPGSYLVDICHAREFRSYASLTVLAR